MNQLIEINTSESGIKTVNARDLHSFLESGQEFRHWIKSRIEQYDFVEGADFTVHKFLNGRATQTDYHVTIDIGHTRAGFVCHSCGRGGNGNS